MPQHQLLLLDVFVEPMFQENTYLLWTASSPAAWIVDPGLPPQADSVATTLRERGLQAAAILLTHAHVDHIAGVQALRDTLGPVPLYAPPEEELYLGDPVANLSSMLGLPLTCPPADEALLPGLVLMLGPLTWQVLDVRGHSPGGRALYCPAAGVVLTGDTLFAGGIGRTDFPGCDEEALIDNIRQNLLTLPYETVVYPGHGPESTIGRERIVNRFVQGDD